MSQRTWNGVSVALDVRSQSCQCIIPGPLSDPDGPAEPDSLLGNGCMALFGEIDGGAINSGVGRLKLVEVWR